MYLLLCSHICSDTAQAVLVRAWQNLHGEQQPWWELSCKVQQGWGAMGALPPARNVLRSCQEEPSPSSQMVNLPGAAQH